jgi:hypothetical protein
MLLNIIAFQQRTKKESVFPLYVQFETRNFEHHCQYTVKKCKIGFTLLTSILPFATILIDMRLT